MATSGPLYKTTGIQVTLRTWLLLPEFEFLSLITFTLCSEARGFEVGKGLGWDYPNSMLKSVHFDRLAIALWFTVTLICTINRLKYWGLSL